MKKLLTFLVLGSSVILLFGCIKKIGSGNTITIDYVATFSDGTIFKSTIDKQPLTFVVDNNKDVISGIHQAVKNMKKNKEQTLIIQPKNGYGYLYDNKKRETIAYMIFKSLNIEPQENTYYDLGKIKGRVKGIEGQGEYKKIIFDTNPRETRDTLNYKITVIDVEK